MGNSMSDATYTGIREACELMNTELWSYTTFLETGIHWLLEFGPVTIEKPDGYVVKTDHCCSVDDTIYGAMAGAIHATASEKGIE